MSEEEISRYIHKIVEESNNDIINYIIGKINRIVAMFEQDEISASKLIRELEGLKRNIYNEPKEQK
jgi:DNA-binding phage protein